MTASSPRRSSRLGSSSRQPHGSSQEALPVLVDRLRWDRRRHPYSGRREYSQAARGVAAIAEQVLAAGDAQAARALVPLLRKAVDRVTRALQYLDDSSGVIGQDLRDLMEAYARACCAAPPSPGPLAGWLVGLVFDGPGWPEVKLVEFVPALGTKGLSRVADLVAERSPVRAAEPASVGQVDRDRWHEEWAARYLREQLAQLTGDVDHYVAVLAEYLAYTDRYRMIAAALRDAGRRAEAIGWARRGLAAGPGDPHADRLRDLLVDLLIEVGDPDAAVTERRSDFEHRPIAATFQALHATAVRVGLDPGPVTDWALALLQARVTDDPRFAPHLVTVLLTADQQDQAWDVALTHPDQVGELQLVELLALRAATHLHDVIQPYRDLIERHILDSHDKWRYERALRLMAPLRAVHQALGDEIGWTEYVEGLRDQHRIRPTFQRKLDTWLAKGQGRPKTARRTT